MIGIVKIGVTLSSCCRTDYINLLTMSTTMSSRNSLYEGSKLYQEIAILITPNTFIIEEGNIPVMVFKLREVFVCYKWLITHTKSESYNYLVLTQL